MLKVSIIVLAYNNYEYLDITMKSILGQDYKGIEIIICDDCSTTHSSDEIKQIIDNYKNLGNKEIFFYYNENNVGTVKNANKALTIATGEIIKFLSPGDTFFLTGSLRTQVEELMSEDCSVMVAQSIIAIGGEKLNKNFLAMPKIKKIAVLPPSELWELLLEENIINTVGSIYKKDIFKKYNLFDENYYLLEDWPTWLKLTKNNEKIKFVETITTVYKWGGVSTTRKNKQTGELLDNDILQMYEKEIIPFLNNFNALKKYRILFLYNRIQAKRCPQKIKKVSFILSYFLYIFIKRIPLKIRRFMYF